MVNVFALAGGALDQIIDVTGRAAIEAVLDISAADVAGEKQPGKERKGGGAAYHGRQRGRAYLADRAVRVERPRLRSPGEGRTRDPGVRGAQAAGGTRGANAGTAAGRPEHAVLGPRRAAGRRWAAAAFLDAEKGYRRIMDYKDLWMLKAHLDELGTPPVDGKEVAA